MPIVNSTYSADLRATILGAGCGAVDGPALTALCDAIVAATVRAIHTATVTSTVVGTSATGGPVTGTATGSIA